MTADPDPVDVRRIVPGHHLLPHERWFASRVYKEILEADQQRTSDGLGRKGSAGVVLEAAGRATAAPAGLIMITLLVSSMALGASTSHLAVLYLGMRVGVPVTLVLLLLSIVRFEQGGRAARSFQAEQAAGERPPPPPTP